jgi:hypothetical protein
VVRRCVRSRNRVNEEALAHWGLSAPNKNLTFTLKMNCVKNDGNFNTNYHKKIIFFKKRCPQIIVLWAITKCKDISLFRYFGVTSLIQSPPKLEAARLPPKHENQCIILHGVTSQKITKR